MDQLVFAFLIYIFVSLFIGGEGASPPPPPPPPPCLVDNCSNEYRSEMARYEIRDAQSSVVYCNILMAFQKCLATSKGRCRGNISYHTWERACKMLAFHYCPLNGKPFQTADGLKANDTMTMTTTTTTTTTTTVDEPDILPASCRYNGRNVFRQCGVFGDPHLKTFDSKYQTCRLQGEWFLINNPYMSVALTSEFVDEASVATAPTKIVIVIKSRSTPCTLEQRYEASSSVPDLPRTFVDGTDRPGADETVSLKYQRDERLDYETVEIRMKYVATRLLVRRVGRYFAFSAQLPEEVVLSSATYDQAGSAVELCSAGCPDDELLRNVQRRRDPSAAQPKLDREAALSQCRRVLVQADADADADADANANVTTNTNTNTNAVVDSDSDSASLHRNNLTGSFLEWCVFDLMTLGPSSDLVTLAHIAQADAHTMDPSTTRDDAETSLMWPADDGQSETPLSTAAAATLITTPTSLIRRLLLLPVIVAALYATS